MKLHNKENREVLKERILQEKEHRMTVSFYNYYHLKNAEFVRDYLFIEFDKLGVLGRIYVAKEGINAQASVPTKNWDAFVAFMESVEFLKGLRLNTAVENDDKSFFKLIVRLKEKI
ncbi:MAG: hypothetical protein LPK45_04210, partial [Bacteroidota bacterium]|nr:hypothetical protein [Bacteroidota bacterium]MDX5430257.1 hypothetical protein [Bacteroidota bacterium]MDX5469018.1 hypothetical protein [Bacteroidota bacterium]